MRAAPRTRATSAAIGKILVIVVGVVVVFASFAPLANAGALSARPSDQTGTIARNGEPVGVSITTAGDNARFTFSSVAGQKVSALLSNSTFGAACGAVAVSLLRPNGSNFGKTVTTCKTRAFLDSQTLDADGNWTILVDPQGSNVGTASLQAFNTNDETGLAHLDGSQLAVQTTNPGENAAIHVLVDSGQKVSVLVTKATYKGCPGYVVALVRPDGSAFGSSVSSCHAGAFLDGQIVDQTGTWTIEIDPQKQATGSATLQAYDATDAERAISLNGAPVNVDLVPGQVGRYSFSGTVGQQVSAQTTGSTIRGCPGYTLSLVRPNGTTLGQPVNGCHDAAFLDTLTLDANGTWNIVVDPAGSRSGTATLNGFTFADDVGTVDLSGKPAFLDFNKPGQNARWTFAGTSGERVSAYVTDSTVDPCGTGTALSLVRPDGTTLGAPATACGSSVYLETQALDQTGTWTAVVDPQGPGIGEATLQVFRVEDTVTTFKPGPALKTFTSETPGTNATYHFTGKVGDTRTVTITGSTYAGCPALAVSLLRPNGTVRSTMTTCTKTLTLPSVGIDAAGTWTLFIDPQGPATGTMIIRLT